ncbi:MAG TPA: outer membrane lipoprotein-sorting protein [Parvularculaceae bacterium]|nr:outer membrane lipoprotein-sorting protein [Caulobacterales bacterium]HPE32530.1 outer membrane lipoprotein-sorting protein [Parvularculaceae bacterium]HRX38546.1 outer membrane lipoprotein-sorting protein [Parvularculaceae bacterium]
MRRIPLLTTFIAGAFALTASIANAEDAPAAQDIANKASAASYYQGKDGKAVVSMKITDSQGRERDREFTILRTDVGDVDNGEQRFYVLFARPADVKGTAFMVWKHEDKDDDRWLYLPALDLVKRIAASDERTSFVGSHFYYEDVSGRSPSEDTHVLIETTPDYYVLDSTPKNPSAVEFAKYRNYIHKATFIPVKTEYYDANGEVYRVYSATKVDVIAGKPTVTASEMDDKRIGGKTTMSYTTVEYDLGLPEDIFTERYLRTPPREYVR